MNSEEDGGTKRNRSFAASIVFRTNLKLEAASSSETLIPIYRGADKSFARTGRKQARKHVRDVRDFNNIETRAVIKFFFFFPARQGAEANSRHCDRNISLFPS